MRGEYENRFFVGRGKKRHAGERMGLQAVKELNWTSQKNTEEDEMGFL